MHRLVLRALPCLASGGPLRLLSMSAAVSTATADGSAAEQQGSSGRADHLHLTAGQQRRTTASAAMV